MQSPQKQSLPFVTRDMLSFEHGLPFSLRINSQANAILALTIRGMTREGIFTFVHNTRADCVVKSENFRIPDMPIMVSVLDEAGTILQGACYITLDLLANADRLYELCAGQVYSSKGLSYPPSSGVDALPNRGIIRELSSADPAPGAEIDLSIPSGRIWRILGLAFFLTAAATAGSRRVHLVFLNPSGFAYEVFGSVDQIISEAKQYRGGIYGSIQDETD